MSLAADLYQQGLSHYEAGRFESASNCFRMALAVQPGHGTLYYALGSCQIELQQLEEAASSLIRAVELQPDNPQAHGNLGTVLLQLRHWDRARQHYEKVLELTPQDPLAHNNMGHYFSPTDAHLAARHYRQAIELDPENRLVGSNLLLAQNYLEDASAEAVYAEHLAYSNRHESELPRPPVKDVAKSHLRLGIVSPDLRKHPVAFFSMPLFRNLDRKRFELVAYHNNSKYDAMSEQLKACCTDWHNVAHMDDDELVETIRNDGIDILVDLAGHTADNRLSVFMRRPAALQIAWLGYPATTGLACMDYCLTDPVLDQAGDQRYYREKLFFLTEGYCAYEASVDSPPVTPSPALTNGYVTFGSMNILCKINPSVVELWSQVLLAVPESRLLICRDRVTPVWQSEILAVFAQHGIEAERLQFKNRVEEGQTHLDVYALMDIHLDALPWSSHTTACEALWMGVPAVTLAGDRHAGRLCASTLRQAGLEQWVAEDNADFVEICKQLSADTEALSQQRAGLRQQIESSALCDGEAFTRGFERALETMWKETAASD